jgi:hypothetical protein
MPNQPEVRPADKPVLDFNGYWEERGRRLSRSYFGPCAYMVAWNCLPDTWKFKTAEDHLRALDAFRRGFEPNWWMKPIRSAY